MVALTCPPGPTYCGDTIVLADVAGRGWQVASGTGDGPTTIISGGPGFVAAGFQPGLEWTDGGRDDLHRRNELDGGFVLPGLRRGLDRRTGRRHRPRLRGGRTTPGCAGRVDFH